MAFLGTSSAFFAVLAVMEIWTVIPGLSASGGFAVSTHTSIVVLPGSRAGLTRLSLAGMGSSWPAISIAAALPVLIPAACACERCALAIKRLVFITVSNGWFAEASSPG